MIIPAFKRRQMLKASSPTLTNDEIRQAQRDAALARKQRKKTARWLYFSKAEEVVESGRKKVGRIFGQKEKELCVVSGEASSVDTPPSSFTSEDQESVAHVEPPVLAPARRATTA